MKSKIMLYCLIIILFCFCWYTISSSIISLTPIMDEYWLSRITGSAQGYSSLRNYKYIYSTLFLMFAPFLLDKQRETAPFISRYTSKKKIYCKRIKDLVIYSLIFTFIHIWINIFGIQIYFEISSQLFFDFLKISAIQAVYVFLYFIFIALLYSIFVDVMKKMFNAQLLTLVVVFVLARLEQLKVWTPVLELNKYGIYYTNTLTWNILLWGLALSMMLCTILMIVLHETLKKRDFIND